MSSGNILLGLIMLVAAGLSGGLFFYYLYARPRADLRGLMASRSESNNYAQEMRERLEQDETGEEFERLKTMVRGKHVAPKEPSFEDKMFRAGLFTEQQKKDFRRIQILGPFVGLIVFGVIGTSLGSIDLIVLVALIGLLIGFYAPYKILARRQAMRDEEILFYLPLVIEQIAIGVSSSLDVGPCLQRVVQMADERDSHNPVTEFIRYAQFHVRSGVSLEEALLEVANLSGHTELKHTFMALAQVAKFGGEVTRQLQELADAVATQRETKIEGKIKKLELVATGPVALVFAGFMLILLIGFGLQVLRAF